MWTNQRVELEELLRIISEDLGEKNLNFLDLNKIVTHEEVSFTKKMFFNLALNKDWEPSDKQVFWMRDIKDKVVMYEAKIN